MKERGRRTSEGRKFPPDEPLRDSGDLGQSEVNDLLAFLLDLPKSPSSFRISWTLAAFG